MDRYRALETMAAFGVFSAANGYVSYSGQIKPKRGVYSPVQKIQYEVKPSRPALTREQQRKALREKKKGK